MNIFFIIKNKIIGFNIYSLFFTSFNPFNLIQPIQSHSTHSISFNPHKHLFIMPQEEKISSSSIESIISLNKDISLARTFNELKHVPLTEFEICWMNQCKTLAFARTIEGFPMHPIISIDPLVRALSYALGWGCEDNKPNQAKAKELFLSIANDIFSSETDRNWARLCLIHVFYIPTNSSFFVGTIFANQRVIDDVLHKQIMDVRKQITISMFGHSCLSLVDNYCKTQVRIFQDTALNLFLKRLLLILINEINKNQTTMLMIDTFYQLGKILLWSNTNLNDEEKKLCQEIVRILEIVDEQDQILDDVCTVKLAKRGTTVYYGQLFLLTAYKLGGSCHAAYNIACSACKVDQVDNTNWECMLKWFKLCDQNNELVVETIQKIENTLNDLNCGPYMEVINVNFSFKFQ